MAEVNVVTLVGANINTRKSMLDAHTASSGRVMGILVAVFAAPMALPAQAHRGPSPPVHRPAA